MTVSSEVNRKEYAGDDSTVAFPTTFNFALDGDLKVILVSALGVETVQTITTHYTVTGAGSDSGGTVTMITAPATGEELVIVRDVALTQGADYVPNDPFPAETHEDALDRLTYIVQQLSTVLARTLRLPDGETDSNVDMELPVDIGGYLSSLFGTDTAGKARMYTLAELLLMDAGNVAITGGTISGTTIIDPRRGCLVHLAANQSIPNDTATVVAWDTEIYDTDSIHAAGGFTIPAGVTKIRLSTGTYYAANATGYRFTYFEEGTANLTGQGSNRVDSPSATGSALTSFTSAVLDVAGGEVFSLYAYQNSGGALNVLGGVVNSWACVEILE